MDAPEFIRKHSWNLVQLKDFDVVRVHRKNVLPVWHLIEVYVFPAFLIDVHQVEILYLTAVHPYFIFLLSFYEVDRVFDDYFFCQYYDHHFSWYCFNVKCKYLGNIHDFLTLVLFGVTNQFTHGLNLHLHLIRAFFYILFFLFFNNLLFFFLFFNNLLFLVICLILAVFVYIGIHCILFLCKIIFFLWVIYLNFYDNLCTVHSLFGFILWVVFLIWLF